MANSHAQKETCTTHGCDQQGMGLKGGHFFEAVSLAVPLNGIWLYLISTALQRMCSNILFRQSNGSTAMRAGAVIAKSACQTSRRFLKRSCEAYLSPAGL